jgi:hypothetical protein
MSTQIDNFTVTEVNNAVALGGVIPSTVLTLSPNSGYVITASDFSLKNAPTSPVSSVVFSQDGSNVLMTIGFDGTTVSSDLSIPICMAGKSTIVQVNLEVSFGFNVSNAASSLAQSTINISGPYNSTSNVFTSIFTADAGFYFSNNPTCTVTTGDSNSYALTGSKTFDGNMNLIAVTFSATYTFPVADVTGDEIEVVALAIALPDVAPVKVRSYNFTNIPFSTAGETRRFIANGTAGANWTLTINNGATPSTYTSVIPSGGRDFIDVAIPAAFNTTYTFTLSGDLASTFPQANPFTISQAGDIATLSTNLVTVIGSTVATSGGQAIVTSDTVTEKGVEWSLTSDFSVIAGFTTEGGTNADFTSSITGLTVNTSYFVRAYATSASGTGYGQVLQFNTANAISLLYGNTSTFVCCTATQATTYYIPSGETFLSAGTILLANGTAAPDGYYRELTTPIP